MKILHTSDWHIGKKLVNGKDRFEEYRAVIHEISEVVKENNVELVLIAGDIYDTYTPPAEAEKIFYSGVREIAQTAAVLIISGNHDDYVRLSAASSLAEDAGVYIIGNNLQKLSCTKIGNCYPVESDFGYAIFENKKGERVYINTLPYPNEARFKEGKTDESFIEKMKRWIDYGQRANTENLPSIFLSHIFVTGGNPSESEREIDLGGARLVPQELLPKCSYCALGHLHKRQKLGENIYYSGAIMQFNFDEALSKKSLNMFDLTQFGVENLTQIELKKIKNLVRLQADGVEHAEAALEANSEAYAELTLNLKEPLTQKQAATLRSHENLISLKTNIDNPAYSYGGVSNKNKSSSELFCDYYKTKFNAAPSADLLELFLSLTEEE